MAMKTEVQSVVVSFGVTLAIRLLWNFLIRLKSRKGLPVLI